MRKFILGTDWWSDCDDAVAVRILSRAAKEKRIELLGIVINACMDLSVCSLDSFLKSEGISNLPIGLDASAVGFYGRISYQHALAKSGLSDMTNQDAEDPVRLYRRLLASSDTKVEILEIGFLQAVSALLLSTPDDISPLSGIELVREKVERFWVMAGKWDTDGGREHNFCLNEITRRAAKIFCELCPVRVTFLGFEVGVDVITGSTLKDGDLLHNILTDHGSKNGRPSWDPMLVLAAITHDMEKAGYREIFGRASVDEEDGANHFKKENGGPHSYLVKIHENSFYQNTIDSLII